MHSTHTLLGIVGLKFGAVFTAAVVAHFNSRYSIVSRAHALAVDNSLMRHFGALAKKEPHAPQANCYPNTKAGITWSLLIVALLVNAQPTAPPAPVRTA